MKRHLIICSLTLSLICLLASCTDSPQKRAANLVETEIKKSLYIPESYNLADIKVDSAFAPYDNPEFIDQTQELIDIGRELEEAKAEIKQAKSSISIWSYPYGGYFSNNLNEARADLKAAQAKEEQAITRGKKIAEEMKRQMAGPSKFIGYKAYVSYRAKNNNGNILMDKMFAIFDKDINNISYMIDGETYEQYQETMKLIHEAKDSYSYH